MKFLHYVVMISLFSLLSCMGNGGGESLLNGERPSTRERQRDSRGDLDQQDRRDAEINRLRRADQIIDSTLDNRYDGGFYYEGYDGEDCEEDRDCMHICDSRKVLRSSRKKCYSSPKALIENLEDGFRTLVSIAEVENVNIKPALLAGMLDLNIKFVVDLVEDRMSEGDLKSFLAWVAINEDIAEVFLAEDRRSKVMESAFEALGELQTDAKKDKQTGLNTGLIGNDDSFFYLASKENNEAAFEIAYEVLDSVCSSRDCKMSLLCARELKTRRRSRIFGHDTSLLGCKTSASQSRRISRGGICYIHGAVSWSYLTEMIEEREIRDRDFAGRDNEVTVEACNKHCGDKNNKKCERIQ